MLVFLDANVLAAPLTRTLLLLAAERSSYRVTWSNAAEDEANRHLRVNAMPLNELREGPLLGMLLAPSGTINGRFSATRDHDRQILADTERSDADVLVTTDVDDFAEDDLRLAGLVAANPDLFMSIWVSSQAYLYALERIAGHQKRPPTTVPFLHRRLSRNHPRLFESQNWMFGAEPDSYQQPEPGVIFRGMFCLRCGRESESLSNGLGAECRR